MDVARQPASSIAMATPHPSWDAARPNDEVIRRGAGEAGRQPGPAGAWQAPKPACHRHALHPESQGHPCWTSPPPSLHRGGRLCRLAFGWQRLHGACRSTKIPTVPGRADLAPDHSSQPETGGRESRVSLGQSDPQTRAMAGPHELKNKGKTGGCLPWRGPPSTPGTRRPGAPGSEPQIIAPTRLTLIRTSRSR